MLVDPTVTRSMIKVDVGEDVVAKTISMRLAEANLKSKYPFRELSLTPEHRRLRLQWPKPELCGMSQIGKRWFLVTDLGLF